MIIMVCGKGGCGKSTISSLLAREYARMGKRVLVIDTDESNYGLYRQLGCEIPHDLTDYFGGRPDIIKSRDEGTALMSQQWSIDDIPAEYVSERDEVKLVIIGKINDANEGCACAIGLLTKNLLPNLALSENDVVIVDSEAGVEHFGRGIDNQVDKIVMVIDPSYESICLSEKIGNMGKTLNKEIYFVLNKATSEQLDMMRSAMGEREIAASIEANSEVLSKGLKGEMLDIELPAIKELANAIV